MSYVKKHSTVVRVPGHIAEMRFVGFHPVETGEGWVVLRRSERVDIAPYWFPLTFTFARTRAEALGIFEREDYGSMNYHQARRAGKVRVVRCVLQPCFPPAERYQMTAKKKRSHRSAKSGHYASAETAAKSPDTHVSESIALRGVDGEAAIAWLMGMITGAIAQGNVRAGRVIARQELPKQEREEVLEVLDRDPGVRLQGLLDIANGRGWNKS